MTTRSRPHHRLSAVAVIAAAALLCSAAVQANDRPFESARTAVAEDDEQVWSFESWVRRVGPLRSFSVEPEYVFDTAQSVQVELTRNLDRRGEETGHEAEIEYKYLFNKLAREGWGVGISAALGAERSAGTTVRSLSFKLPLSLDLGQLTGGDSGPLLHLNAGLHKAGDERRHWTGAVGAEHRVLQRSLLFAEWSHDGADHLAQAGLRHWVKKEKLALDIAWQQRRNGGERSSGWIAGIGWYDL